jgi:hypothetical protein
MTSKTLKRALLLVWLCYALFTIIALPDYERYKDRLERTAKLLETHCSTWSWLGDSEYVSPHDLVVTKCFPKHS